MVWRILCLPGCCCLCCSKRFARIYRLQMVQGVS